MKVYIQHDRGCSVVEAKSIAAARNDANAEYGSRNIKLIRKAEPKDVDWFLAMGGHIYEV